MAVDPTVLVQALAGLCDEVRQLRDDLYNHALITNGEAFGALSERNTIQLTTSQMPPAADATVKEIKNTHRVPATVVIRCEPAMLQEPPNGLIIEDTLLYIGYGGAGAATSKRASVMRMSKGQSVTVVVRPNESIFVSAAASATVTITWLVLPLRGRSNLFRE